MMSVGWITGVGVRALTVVKELRLGVCCRSRRRRGRSLLIRVLHARSPGAARRGKRRVRHSTLFVQLERRQLALDSVETRLGDAATTHAQSDVAVPLLPRESRRSDAAHSALPRRRRRLRQRPPRSRRDRRLDPRRRFARLAVHPGTRARLSREEEEAAVKWGAPLEYLAASMARLGRQGRRDRPRNQTKELRTAPLRSLGERSRTHRPSHTVVQLDKLHAKHLLPGFKDRSAEEREIEALATSITTVSTPRLSIPWVHPDPTLTPPSFWPRTQDFRTCQSHIRRIAEQSQSLLANRPRDPVEAEMKRIDLIMAANVQTALATRVQELSTTFRKKQADYLRRESLGIRAEQLKRKNCADGRRPESTHVQN